MYLGNHVLERLHDLRALGLLEVGEAASDDDHSRQHDTQVQLRGDQRRHIQLLYSCIHIQCRLIEKGYCMCS